MRNFFCFIILIILSLLCSINIEAAAVSLDNMSKYPTSKLMDMGKTYLQNGKDMDSALICYSIVMNRYDDKLSRQEQQQCAEACMNLWDLYFSHYCDYTRAYESLTRCIDIHRNLGEESAYDYLLLGGFYETLFTSNKEKSLGSKGLAYMRKSFSMAIKGSDTHIQNMAFSNLVLLADEVDGLSTVSKDWDAYSRLNLKDPVFDYNKLLYTGLKLMSEGKYSDALQAFRRQQSLVGNDPDKVRYLFMAYYNEATVLFKQGNNAAAISCMKKAEALAKKNGAKDAVMSAYQQLAEYYKKSGDVGKAQYYQICYYQLNDSLLGYRQMNQINELKYIEQIRQSKERLTIAEQQHRFDAMLVLALMVIAVIVIVFLIVLFRKNKRLAQKNQMLFDRNEELIKTTERKSNRRQEGPQPSQIRSKVQQTENDEKEAIAERLHEVMTNSDEIYSPEFNLARLSELAGIPQRNVSQAINDNVGTNFRQYLNRYRIDEACRRLKSSQVSAMTLEAIGASVGFKSRTSFISSFKKQTGLTPSEYLTILHNDTTKD